jgi:hypothetical protein
VKGVVAAIGDALPRRGEEDAFEMDVVAGAGPRG